VGIVLTILLRIRDGQPMIKAFSRQSTTGHAQLFNELQFKFATSTKVSTGATSVRA
jgi:hypothetical protein